MTTPTNWNTISVQEASQMLFFRLVELLLTNKGWTISADTTVRILTQRLYGDYRQIQNTQEFKRAERHIYIFKNTGLGKELF